MRNGPVIELEHVSAALEDQTRLENLTLTVEEGECLALVGRNGSGKGLVLELIAGFEEPTEGIVRILGKEWARLDLREQETLRQRIGFVFQKSGLMVNMTVYNNLALPLRYHTSLDETAIRAKVQGMLEEFGIERSGDRFPAQLSLGDARLAAMARALILGQDVLLIDQPVVGLDAECIERLRAVFRGYRKRTDLTILMAVNVPVSLLEDADRVGIMHEGRIVHLGTLKEVRQAVDSRAAVYVTPYRGGYQDDDV